MVQWEDFERHQEEMAIWLADMDLKLTEVEHFSEMNTYAKMRQLQVHINFYGPLPKLHREKQRFKHTE